MRKFVQILWEKAHWIFYAEEMPQFDADTEILDITHLPHVKERWDYNRETNTFSEPYPD